MMDDKHGGKVKMTPAKGNSMPAHPVKTGGATKGFGGGSMPKSLEGNDTIGKGGNGKAPVRGFSGGGLLGGKV